MENPFKKLFGGGAAVEELPETQESSESNEQKKVVDHGFEMRDGIGYVWKKFGDGTTDYAGQEALNSSDKEGMEREIKSKRREWGVDSE